MDPLIVIPLAVAPFLLVFLCILVVLLWPRARDSEGTAGCLNRRIRRKLRPSVPDASTLQNDVSRKQRLSDVDFGAVNEAIAIAPGQQVKVSEPIMSVAGEQLEVWRPSRSDTGRIVGYSGPEQRALAEVKLGDTWQFKHVTLVASDLGHVVRLDSRGDVLIRFEWDQKELWIDRRDFRFLVPTSGFHAHCDEACTTRHDANSKCFMCGEPYSQHKQGHKCADGARASFLLGSFKKDQAVWALHNGVWKAGKVLKVDPLRVALDEWQPPQPLEPEMYTPQRLGFDQDTCRLFGYPSTAKPTTVQPRIEPLPDLMLATEHVPMEMPKPGFLCGCGDGGGTRGPQRVTPASPAKLCEGAVYTWAWGDLPLGASLNPLRWSSYKIRQSIAAELRTYDYSTNFRPVHVMDRWEGNMIFCDARVAIAQLGAETDEANLTADHHMHEIVCCFPEKKVGRPKVVVLPSPVGQ